MKIITYNVNGIRAAINKGFVQWLEQANPDVICLQEVKANLDQIDQTVFENLGYKVYWNSAVKKGYSGVAILCKFDPEKIFNTVNISAYDDEGRYLAVVYKDVLIISCYFPSGTSGEDRQNFKYKFLDDLLPFITEQKKNYSKIVLAGDYNIYHQPIDIHDPVGNKKSSGFLPEEREWLTKFFESGWIDTFRHFNKEPHQYTWWSNWANSRKNNKGWRIDYLSITPALLPNLKSSKILSDVVHSDHCPVELVLDI